MTRSLEQAVLWAFVAGLGFSITLAETALAALVLLRLFRLRNPAGRAALALPLGVPFLGFITATLLADLFSADIAGSILASKDLLLILVFFAVVNTLEGVEGAEWLLRRLFLVLTAVAALSVLQVSLCSLGPWGVPPLDWFFRKCFRARGFYSIYMTLAGVLTLVLLAALPRLMGRERARWEAPAWVLMLVALVLTYTRGAWLGFLAGVASLLLLIKQRRALAMVGGSALLLFGLLLAASATLSRQGWDPRRLADPATARERLYMWQAGITMLARNPVTGVGVGQVKALYPAYALPEAVKRSTSHLHSAPIQVLVERGVLGLGCWLWLWVAFFVRGLGILRQAQSSRARALVAGSLGAILGFLVGGLSEYNFGDSEVAMTAYALMAVPFLVERR